MRFLIMNGAGNRFAVFDARPDYGGNPRFTLTDAQVAEICARDSAAMGPKGADQLIILSSVINS